MRKLPKEFSFKLSDNDEIIFYAKDELDNEGYIVAWNSPSLNRICFEHYLTDDMIEMVNKSKWILVNEYND